MKLWNDGLMGGRAEIDEYEKGGTPWCVTYTFMPDELAAVLTRFCVKNDKRSQHKKKCRTAYHLNQNICRTDIKHSDSLQPVRHIHPSLYRENT